jgi:predicted DNA-binding transcriptional regulator YafY
MFTDDEVEAISVALTLLSRVGDHGLVEASNRVSEKIANVLPHHDLKRIELAHLKVSNWNTIPRATVDVQTVRQAVRGAFKLGVTYRDADGIFTKRTIWPLALIYYIDNILLAAWCELRADYRHFRLERFESCFLLPEKFSGADRLRSNWEVGRELFGKLDAL